MKSHQQETVLLSKGPFVALCATLLASSWCAGAPVVVTPGALAGYVFYPPAATSPTTSNSNGSFVQTCYFSPSSGDQTINTANWDWTAQPAAGIDVLAKLIGGTGGGLSNLVGPAGGGGGSSAIVVNGTAVAVANGSNANAVPVAKTAMFTIKQNDILRFVSGGGGGMSYRTPYSTTYNPNPNPPDDEYVGAGGGAGYTGGGGGGTAQNVTMIVGAVWSVYTGGYGGTSAGPGAGGTGGYSGSGGSGGAAQWGNCRPPGGLVGNSPSPKAVFPLYVWPYYCMNMGGINVTRAYGGDRANPASSTADYSVTVERILRGSFFYVGYSDPLDISTLSYIAPYSPETFKLNSLTGTQAAAGQIILQYRANTCDLLK